MTVFPNSAPDSFTPKNWNLVRLPEQMLLEGDGDELVVDRARRPTDGAVVVAILDGELTVKRLRLTRAGVVLAAENPAYPE